MENHIKERRGGRRNVRDMRGQKIGRLTVLEPVLQGDGTQSAVWKCLCECGRTVEYNRRQLIERPDPDCGCLRNEAEPPFPAPSGAKWIPLTRGQFTLVDEADYDLVSGEIWSAFASNGGMYYASNLHLGRLHRWLIGATRETFVDHRNGNPLDNRKSNLRFCTERQNCQNRRLRADSQYPFKGLRWRTGGWEASIHTENGTKGLGRFDNPEQAGRAYDIAALEAFGEFARLNFPLDGCSSISLLPGGVMTWAEPNSSQYEAEHAFAEIVLAYADSIGCHRMEQIVGDMRCKIKGSKKAVNQ